MTTTRGPWRDRTYVVKDIHRPAPSSGRSPEQPWPGVSQLHAYLAGIVLGAILGAGALVLLSPYLPFVVLR